MEKYIEKLNTYLDEYTLELKKRRILFAAKLKNGEITKNQFETARQKIKKFYNIASNIKMFFAEDKVDYFNYFVELSHMLEDPAFSSRDVYSIIRYIVDKNYKSSTIASTMTINLSAIQDYRFKSATKEEVFELIKTGRLQKLLQSTLKGKEETVNEKEEKILEEIVKNAKTFIYESKTFDTKIRIIHNHLNKFASQKDADKTIKCLKSLGVSDECIEKIRMYLEKEVKKSESRNKKENKAPSTLSEPKQKTEKRYLTEEEVRTIKKEIRDIYDIYHHAIKRIPDFQELISTIDNLRKLDEISRMDMAFFITRVVEHYIEKKLVLTTTYDEMIHLAGIMSHYKVEERKIYAFICYASEHLNKEYTDALEEYLALIPKLKYLDPETASILDEYYQNYNNSDDVTKSAIQSLIGEEIDKVNMDKSYRYEMHEAKKKGEVW